VVTFWACRRLGETTVPSVAKFDPKFHVTKGTSFSQFNGQNGASGIGFHVPWTKTTRELCAEVVVAGLPHGLCGVAGLLYHLFVNKDVPDSFSLFGYMDSDGQPKYMVKNVFLTFCFDVWKKADMCDVL
jgi:hypothetical protein